MVLAIIAAIIATSVLGVLIRYLFLSKSYPSGLPPGKLGRYRVEEAQAFFRDMNKFGLERKKRYGDVFSTNIFYQNSIAGGGVEFNRWWAKVDDKALIMKWPPNLQPIFGDHSILTVNGEKHARLRKMLLVAFTPRALENYMGIICAYTRQFVAAAPTSPVAIQPWIKKYTFSVGCSVLVGSDFGDKNEEMLALYHIMSGANDVGIPINLPFTIFGKAMKARNTLVKIFEEYIIKCGQEDSDSNEMKNAAQLLLKGCGDEAGTLNMVELTENILLLLSAGHDTTASGISSVLMFLAKHKDVYEKLKTEVCDTFPNRGTPLDLPNVKSMPYLDAVIKEALRLVPPFPAHFRATAEDTSVNGYHVPKNFLVVGMPCVAHYDEKIYHSPYEFVPERWLGSNFPAHSFFTFGDGPRLCIGMELAKIEMKVFIIEAVRNLTWQIGDVNMHPYTPHAAHYDIQFFAVTKDGTDHN